MGKPTGFLEFERRDRDYAPVEERVKHWREFVESLPAEELKRQGGRCMDCGTPYCHPACPVNNVIPDWNDLVFEGDFRSALDVLHSTNNFPDVTGRICPAPCEAACTLNLFEEPVTIKTIEQALVERGWDGVDVGRTDHKMGVRGVDTGELVLSDVHVPAENVIGEVGGFRLAMLGLNAMRPIVAARGIGLAEGALMYATEYVQQRVAFGKTIADFQGIQWEIAKCAVDIEAARLLTYRAAVLADAGKFTKEYVPYLSMAKYHATELAVRASSLAVQLLGAAGYMEDHPTEQWYRDAKQLTIVEGTSQVQLDLIARGVLDGDLWWD